MEPPACACSSNNRGHCLLERWFPAPPPEAQHVQQSGLYKQHTSKVKNGRRFTYLSSWKPEFPVMISRQIHSIKHPAGNCCQTSEENLCQTLQKTRWGAEIQNIQTYWFTKSKYCLVTNGIVKSNKQKALPRLICLSKRNKWEYPDVCGQRSRCFIFSLISYYIYSITASDMWQHWTLKATWRYFQK